jgi:phenylalanyl-tRNA synthetase beta subunit
MTLKVAAQLPYEQLETFVRKAYGSHAIDDTHIQMELIDIYQKPEDADYKHVTFRFTTTAKNRTLTDSEVNKVLDAVAATTHSELGTDRI